ncbi:MAG: YlmH/Sll1252 family protein [Clostridiales bacterium]|nr:YlmH/Sll1252 family protein [Clostridiales bacterium]
MNKTELLRSMTVTTEERQLLSHVLDLLQAAETRSLPTRTAFLSPAERGLVLDLMDAMGGAKHVFSGGYAEAERVRCAFLPQWQEPEDMDPNELTAAVRATWYAAHPLTHRDFLGSLMGLGVKREAIGDILVSPGSCDILLLPELAPFVVENLTHAGREKLRVSPVELDNLHFPQPEVKTIHDTVPSLRLDAVAAAGFSASRKAAAEAISAGKVALNWRTVTKTDCPVVEGDRLSWQGQGKCRLVTVGNLSRKGRVTVTLERYL